MSGFIWRVILAVVCFVIFWAIFPAFVQLVGFPISAPLMTIIRACVAGLAVIYVLFGTRPPPPWGPSA